MVIALKSPFGFQDSGTYTPADVERKRRLAEMLAADSTQAREPFGALAKALTAGRAGFEQSQAEDIERRERSASSEKLAQILADPNVTVEQLLAGANDPWTSQINQQLAAELLGERMKPEEPYKPDWQTFSDPNSGDMFRWDQNAADSKPELFYDAADKPDEPRGNVSLDGIDYGDPGAGLVWQRDPETRDIAVDERGAPIAIPFRGSKQYDDWLASQNPDNIPTRDEQLAGVVVEDIDRALGLMEKHPDLTSGIGSVLTGWLPGSPAQSVGELIKTVKANAGFDELQAMRESSPTGGALGSITEREISYLQSVIGSLEQSQERGQLTDNLLRVRNAYLDIIHGPNGGPPRIRPSFQGEGDATALPDPMNPADGGEQPEITEGAIAENPETGERIIFRNGRWERL